MTDVEAQNRHTRWRKRPSPSTWGDFGADDQRGRLNLITPERRLAALQEARVGKSFCLSLPLDYPGGRALSPFRKPPELRAEVMADGQPVFNAGAGASQSDATDLFCDQSVRLSLQYSTHWDGLAHVGARFDANADGEAECVYYNGFPAQDTHDDGVLRLGVETMAETCVQGRGVMIDLVPHFGGTAHPVGYDDLMRVVEHDGVIVGEGDIVCFRTGFADLLLKMRRQPDRNRLFSETPALDGRDERLLQWITDIGLAAIVADNYAVETLPSRPGHQACSPNLPLHQHCLFQLGVPLGELWHLGDLADWLCAHGRNSFLLTAPPLRLTGAVASPTTPVATV
ncbi:kynurenine formamidase [Rhodoligotrophos appendicifer]|uniref:cyclase family protein n=1 Tax=Rhodoligotrophos appendicifer TaxID=987056 RepID=UPI0011872672|nr:cyclase family protein [Rhodoligotrophos appendicifer]